MLLQQVLLIYCLGGPSIPHTLHMFSADNDDVSGEVGEGGSTRVVVMSRNTNGDVDDECDWQEKRQARWRRVTES